MKVRTLEDINKLVKEGTGIPEIDKGINLYYETMDYTHKRMIKMFWVKAVQADTQFGLNYSEYQRISKNMIDDVNHIIDRYYTQRKELIKEANKKCNNVIDITDMITYRANRLRRILSGKK